MLAWLVNFSQYLVFYLLVTTMALYAVREFAAGDAASGFASSSFVVGATVARLVTGFIVDRLGRRRVMLAALAVTILACALYLPTASLPLLIAVRILHGFAYAFASTAVMAIVQSVIPAARRAEGTGFFCPGHHAGHGRGAGARALPGRLLRLRDPVSGCAGSEHRGAGAGAVPAPSRRGHPGAHG